MIIVAIMNVEIPTMATDLELSVQSTIKAKRIIIAIKATTTTMNVANRARLGEMNSAVAI